MLELRHITRLHEVMREEYGEHFTLAYGSPETWLEALKDSTPEQIGIAIKRMKEENRKLPPILDQFKNYLKASPPMNHAAYKFGRRPKDVVSTKSRGNEFLGDIKKMLK